MRLLRKAGDRPAVAEPPLEHIASILEDAQSMRFASTFTVPGWAGDCTVRTEGFTDFGKRLSCGTVGHEGSTTELFTVDEELFRRLPPEQRERTGKTWVRVTQSERCPYEVWGFAEEAASLRLLARPIGYTAEEHDGETLHHHVLLVKPGSTEHRPGLEGLWEHLRWHGTDRMTYEFWLAEDGRIRLMQQDYKVFRFRTERQGLKAVSVDYWDFGIELDLQPPQADEIHDGPLPE